MEEDGDEGDGGGVSDVEGWASFDRFGGDADG